MNRPSTIRIHPPSAPTSARGQARRAAAMAATLAIVLTACGQKPGVHVDSGATGFVPQAAGAPAPTSDTTQAAPGTVDSGASTPAATPQSGSTTVQPSNTSGTQVAPSTQAPPSGGQQPAAQQPAAQAPPSGGAQVTGTDRTGLSEDTIRLGSHAPVTGAAPLPVTSFEKSGDLYWKHVLDQGQDILGRTKVELLFRDDRYDPNAARQVCRELESEVFTFAGGGGTDQIQACGAYAEAAEVPYFSAGVTEQGLRGNSWYFASSMSYKQQGPLLAQLVKTNPDTAGKRVGAIITDTPNFDDAVEGWEAGVAAEGLDYYKTLRHPKGDTSWYNSYLSDFADNGVEVVYLLTSPVDYIRFAQQSEQSGVEFQYVGVGVSMGLNAVLGSGCDVVDNGIFFSPFPGLDWARQNLPEFFATGERYNAPTDDIALALWGSNATLHELFKKYAAVYGNDLTREDFRTLVENSSIATGVFPELKFSPNDHFGANAVHVLQADCAAGEYKTIHTFASAF